MSLDPRAVELMHARIDGVISERDDAELAGLLDENSEARKRFDELRRLSERLDRMEPVAPPAELRAGVLAAVRPQERPAAKGPDRVRAVLRYAYAVAAGLVLGVLAYHIAANRTFERATVDPSDIAGTMTAREIGQESMITDQIGLDVPGGRGVVQLIRMKGLSSLTFDIDSPDSLDVALGFDPSVIDIHELAQEVGQFDKLDMTRGSIRWSQRGHHRVTVQLHLREEGPAAVELQLFRNEERLYDTVLQLPAPE